MFSNTQIKIFWCGVITSWVISLFTASVVLAQDDTARLEGTVTFAESGENVHGATVLVIGTDRVTLTDEDGQFLIQ